MFLMLQIAILTSLVTYLCQCKVDLRRRNLETWQSLSTQLKRYPKDSVAPWAQFQHARILLEMADYVEFHGSPVSQSLDRASIATIRKEAMQTRLALVITMPGRTLPGGRR